MNNVLIYIAGPMSGYEDFNRASFNACAKQINSQDHNEELNLLPDEEAVAVSPVAIDSAYGLDTFVTEENLEMHLPMISMVNAQAVINSHKLVLLPGWELSRGCTFEVSLAYRLGKPLYIFTGFNVQEISYREAFWKISDGVAYREICS